MTAETRPSADGWCLVLAIWGDRYGDVFVNVLVDRARALGPGCSGVVLLTDRPRPAIRPDVRQVMFGGYMGDPAFFTGGYIAKLSVFRRDALPADTRCVYVDLDTVITGDLGRIAALVRAPDDCFMLPPGGILGFGRIRRAICRISRGRFHATGNSSVVAWSSAMQPNLCDSFEQMHKSGHLTGARARVDDVFLSWFARDRIRPVPPALAVMFRREFLSRWPRLSAWAARLSGRASRRDGLVAITFNGVSYKPASLLALPEGAGISDPRGRRGTWSDAGIGPVRGRIIAYCRAVTENGGR